MDQYGYIRTAYRVYQKSIKQICRETGHSRETVRKVLRSERFVYSPRVEQPYPVMGPYLQVIDQWLAEDKDRPKKQRHTAKRIYDRLVRELGFKGSDSTVRHYVRKAKMRLENVAEAAWAQGIKATVYNCPEIRTNSSDLFNGVELSLYPLIRALRHEGGGPWAEAQAKACQDLMIEGMGLEAMLDEVDAYHLNPIITPFHSDFQDWPKHNSQAMADLMLATSDKVMEMNRDKKNLITDYLSGLVVESSGRIMLNEGYAPRGPVLWLGHDLVAKDLLAHHS